MRKQEILNQAILEIKKIINANIVDWELGYIGHAFRFSATKDLVDKYTIWNCGDEQIAIEIYDEIIKHYTFEHSPNNIFQGQFLYIKVPIWY